MSDTPVPLPLIESAIRDVCQLLNQKDCRRPWEGMSEDDLWRELVACILGSRVPFQRAYAALERMNQANLLSGDRRSGGYEAYELDVINALSGNSEFRTGTRSPSCYPFFARRARQIRTTAERFYARNETIRGLLDKAREVREARRLLASEVSGLGPKQASLFLRNIGYAADVAVLDVHVLTYMHWTGLTTGAVKSVGTVRLYETLERTFIDHACSAGFPPDRFDVAVWVVVRVVKKEYRAWR